MAVKEFYHDIDLVKVSEILNYRVHNVTTAERATLGGTLNANHAGLHVYDTDLVQPYYWDGTQWLQAANVTTAMDYRGAIAFNATEPASPEVGDVYVFNSAGVNTWAGATETVEIGDLAIYNGTDWDYVQQNTVDASETVAGVVELATDAEALTGTATGLAITPANLASVIASLKLAKTYFQSGVTLAADVAFGVAHNLSLQNKDSFTISVKDSAGSEISVDVDSVDANNATITSNVALTGITVTVVGA